MNEEKKCLNCDYFCMWEGNCTRVDSGHLWEQVDIDSVCDKWEEEKIEK